ncbi:MAG: DNA mismatch repair endonuclease MutL [Treponema sp.]|jgi:DNA mismatch repair protein MutL|nr:DNA mismatch repair endonuclease MutL [Treponema sp.]
MARVQVLPPDEARKIAAGEVIDRPAALVRELIDNAIDAGGTRIELSIDGGGIRRIEVIDDGAGMEKEDLELCWQTHATSKIRSMDDLKSAETLGFRGEALAAAATVSHLEILSSADSREAWRLEVGPGEALSARIERGRRKRGTSVRTTGLFDTIPVRKRFLKRDWSEANLCRLTFFDKALAFPAISFRLTFDGKLKTALPAASSLKERFASLLLDPSQAAYLHEIHSAMTRFSVSIVVGGPELARPDRRQQYVFANGRRIQDFSLMQALEYGTQGWFPNGYHPVGAIFVDIDPAMADFNIHPAKREVRFADASAIHHAITSSLRDFVHHRNQQYAEQIYTVPEAEFLFPTEPYKSNQECEYTVARALALDALQESPPEYAPQALFAQPVTPEYAPSLVPQTVHTDLTAYAELAAHTELATHTPSPVFHAGHKLRYVGKAFDIFIIIEKDNRLFFIDQHAAHERILYEQFLVRPVPIQELLVAIPFRTESEEDDQFLNTRRDALERLGVVIKMDRGSWRIEALPAHWNLSDSETIQAILDLKRAGADLVEHWLATLACHRAVKEGDNLDECVALSLAEATLALPVLRCPHGRPILFELSREILLRAVKRV